MADDDAGGGCFIGLVALVLVAFVGGRAYFHDRAREVDDDYFHKEADCLYQGTRVEITISGFSPPCVRVVSAPVRFVNGLSDYQVTLCLGRVGDCELGHYSPFPSGRLILRPGESKDINFPRGSHYWFFGVDRKYPVTVNPMPGISDPMGFDMIVHSGGEKEPKRRNLDP